MERNEKDTEKEQPIKPVKEEEPFDFFAEETPKKENGEAAANKKADREKIDAEIGEKTEANNGLDGEKKRTRRNRRIIACVLSVAFLGVGFLGGYGTYAALLDPEMRSLIWAKKQIDRHYIEELTDEDFYGAIRESVNGLFDPYSYYYSEAEYAAVLQSATGQWIGMGLRFLTADETGKEQLLVTMVSGNSPAERANIQTGTYVIGFGASQDSVKESESYTALTEFLSGYGAGEEFVLKLRVGKTGEVYYQPIAMESFVENYVFYRSKDTSYSFVGEKATEKQPNGKVLSALDQDTAYIRLTEFNGAAAEEFGQAMSVFKAEKKKNLILDLRMNGGGYMNILSEIASYFCKDSKAKRPLIAVAVDKDGDEEVFHASANRYSEYFSADSKISVLADNSTASASECLIGCLYDYKAIGFEDVYLAYRGGEARTFGKGIMQTTYPKALFSLSDAIKLTTAEIFWPVSGKSIHGVGVTETDGAQTLTENYFGDAEVEEAIAKILGV